MINKLMEGENEIILQTCFIYNKTRKEKKQQRINEMRTTKANSKVVDLIPIHQKSYKM